MSSSPFSRRTTASSSGSASPAPPPVFTAAFGHDDLQDENVDEQLAYGLSLDSPPAYVFSNDLAFEPSELDADVETGMDAHEGKAAAMRSVSTQRDTSAFVFEPLITPRSFEGGFVETNIFESTSGKAPVFVLDQALPSPLNANGAKNFDLFTPTILKSDAKKITPSSPLCPAGFFEIPEKERSDFFLSVNPTFTSCASPSTIMDSLKAALATLRCEFATATSCQWTLDVRCLLVAEEISFAIHLLQLRGAETKYEIEFVRRSGDELMFVDLAEHIRAQCTDVDDDGALALFNKTLDAWMDETQEVTARRYVIQETEAVALLDELNCEFLHAESLYQVARSVKNHCRHKTNRKLFVQQPHNAKSLLKGLKWMLADSDELARFALFVLLQFAGDADLCGSFFPTPFEKSSVSLLLDSLDARKDESPSKFTTEMAAAVRQSALFA